MKRLVISSLLCVIFFSVAVVAANRVERKEGEDFGEHVIQRYSAVYPKQNLKSLYSGTIAANIEEIEIQSGPNDVTLSSDPKAALEFFGYEKDGEVKATIENNKMTLELPANPKLNWNITFGSNSFSSKDAPWRGLNGYIPSTVKKITVKSSSGDVKLKDLTVANLSASAGSGNITIGGLSALENINLETGSGDLRLETEVSKLISSTGSGNQKFRLKNCKAMESTAGSGDISIDGTCAAAEISTGSGNVNLKEYDVKPTAKVSTGSGDVKLMLFHKDIGAKISYKTSSGDLRTSMIKEKPTTAGDTESLTIGNGTGQIEVSTGSGNFRIHQQ